MASTVTTYLNLGLRNILGQIADHDLALSDEARTIGRRGLAGVTRRLGALLNAASGGDGSGLAGRGAARGATVARVAALSGENLVERLVELSRHDGGYGVVW